MQARDSGSHQRDLPAAIIIMLGSFAIITNSGSMQHATSCLLHELQTEVLRPAALTAYLIVRPRFKRRRLSALRVYAAAAIMLSVLRTPRVVAKANPVTLAFLRLGGQLSAVLSATP